MMYEDQELKTSDDDPKNKATNSIKATIDVDDEDEINALLDSDEDTPGAQYQDCLPHGRGGVARQGGQGGPRP